MKNENGLKELLDQGNFITLNRALIKNIGLNETLILSELISRDNQFSKEKEQDKDGFYFSQEKIKEIFGFSLPTIISIIKNLERMTILGITKKGLPKRNFYKIDYERILFFVSNKAGLLSDIKNFNDSTLKNTSTILNRYNKIDIKNRIKATEAQGASECDADASQGFDVSSYKKLKEKTNPIKKKEILFYKDVSPITKKCLDLFYSYSKEYHLKTKESSYKSESECYKTEVLIKGFLNGFPKSELSSLRTVILDQGLEAWQSIIDKGIPEKRFFQFFENAIKIYLPEYKPESKKHLPSRLSEFLYSPMRKGIKSYFLHYRKNHLERIDNEKELKIVDPEMVEQYEKDFFGKGFFQDIKQRNLFIKEVNRISEWHKDVIEEKVKVGDKVYFRKNIEKDPGFRVYFLNPQVFIRQHIQWLQELCLNDKITKGASLFKGGFWSSFLNWFEENHQTTIEVSKKYMVEMAEKEKERVKQIRKENGVEPDFLNI